MSKVTVTPAPVTTRKTPTAKAGSDGKPAAPARTGLSDAKIALILAKYGKRWPQS